MEGIVCDFAITEAEKKKVMEELGAIDAATLERLREVIKAGVAGIDAGTITPFTGAQTLARSSAAEKKLWRETGLRLIAEGKVAVLLLAGGQGSRLGYDKPKGMFDVGLPSHKSLFQLQAERLIRVQELACAFVGMECPKPAGLVHWYVLTSGATHDDTVEYFTQNQFFGLDEKCMHFFQQGMLPAVTKEGNILLDQRDRIALSPNGNAGVYQALVHSGHLKAMDERGVEVIFQYGVDNVLATVCDPVFVGFVSAMQADCACKSTMKSYPDEPVGVLAMRDGKPCVAEYTEITKEVREMRDEKTGELVYGAAHICNNAFSVKFLVENALQPLPFHVAHKKVPFVGKDGTVVRPEEPNGFKAEMFIFDMFQYAQKMVALVYDRDNTFSPLKNPSGSKTDCPESCVRDVYRLHRQWLEAAGAKIDATNSEVCEISPLVSYDGEGLEQYAGKTIVLPFTL